MGGTAAVVNVNDVLDGHVAGQADPCRPPCWAATRNRFRREVSRLADAHQVPILKLKTPERSRWDDRKLDHVRPHLQAAERRP